ncbi:MAG TPA: LON peptidase substrate-binding domain-containing protein, partial [Pyrinomonadaceae bacterium]|nr:LON peptidase substrate-binding domain-containing protein [Pyrinomonadaceae bacterium]
MAEETSKSNQTPEAKSTQTPEAKPSTPTPPAVAADAPPTPEQSAAPPSARPAEAGVFEIAVLPLQNTTVFPSTVIPLAAGRARSVAAVEAALATEEKLVACVTVREGRAAETEATPPADLYDVGTLVTVKRMMRVPDALQL